MPKILDTIDKEIVRTLYNVGIPMTISEISKKTGISWITIKKHIKKLLELDLVEEVKTKTRKSPKVIWNFNDFGKNIAEASA